MKTTKILLTIIATGLVLSLGSYKALALDAGYGRIVPNNEVTQAFESHRADSDLNYYFSGGATWPNAIICLNKAYTLDNSLWRKVTTPDQFTNLVSGMQFKALPGRALWGFDILDDMGMKVGVWYSLWNTPTFVKRTGEKAFDIHTPYPGYRLTGSKR